MTVAQEQVVLKIHEMLKEHFDNGFVIVEAIADDRTCEREMMWCGTVTTAIGLTVVAQQRLIIRSQMAEGADE